MSRDDVIENLGTIAHSGTKAFLAKAQEADLKENPELIGQFGVGFYASFMVADEVVVDTKSHNDEEFDGAQKVPEEFTLDEIDKPERGTTITLHLKEDAKKNFSMNGLYTLQSKSFCSFLEHPVIIITTKKDEEESKVEEEKEEQINSQKAIWLRPKKDIKKNTTILQTPFHMI